MPEVGQGQAQERGELGRRKRGHGHLRSAGKSRGYKISIFLPKKAWGPLKGLCFPLQQEQGTETLARGKTGKGKAPAELRDRENTAPASGTTNPQGFEHRSHFIAVSAHQPWHRDKISYIRNCYKAVFSGKEPAPGLKSPLF